VSCPFKLEPYIGTDHITFFSKFWTDPKKMEEDISDIKEEIVRTKRKVAKKFLSTTSQ